MPNTKADSSLSSTSSIRSEIIRDENELVNYLTSPCHRLKCFGRDARYGPNMLAVQEGCPGSDFQFDVVVFRTWVDHVPFCNLTGWIYLDALF